MIGNGGVLSTMGDLLQVEREPRSSDRRRANVRRRDADAHAAHQRTHDHVRARTRASTTIRASAKSATADRRRAIGRSSRAIPISMCRSPCGATTPSANPTALRHQVADLVLAKPSGVAQQQRLGERDAVAGGGAVEMGGDVSGSAHGSNDHAVGRQRVAIDWRTWRRGLDAAGGGSFSGAAGRCHVERRRRRTCAAADSCGWGYGSFRGGSSGYFAEARGLRRDVHERRARCRAHACGKGREARDAAAAGGRVRAAAGLSGRLPGGRRTRHCSLFARDGRPGNGARFLRGAGARRSVSSPSRRGRRAPQP